jgi:hypothetical protein
MAAPSSACRNSVSFDSGPQAARVDGPRVISKNLAIVQERGLVETNSATALESAKQKQTRLLVLNLDEMPANQIASQIQAIVDDLNGNCGRLKQSATGHYQLCRISRAIKLCQSKTSPACSPVKVIGLNSSQ